MTETRRQKERRVRAEAARTAAASQPTASPDNSPNTSIGGRTGRNVNAGLEPSNSQETTPRADVAGQPSPNTGIPPNTRGPTNISHKTTPIAQSQRTPGTRETSVTSPSPKIEVDPECDCKECNPKCYEQWPHDVNPKDKERKYTYRTYFHLPLCNLVDLFSHEPTALIEALIESFSEEADASSGADGKANKKSKGSKGKKKTKRPEESKSKDEGKSEEEMRREAFTHAIAEFEEWSNNRPDSLKKHPESMSTATLQYLFELLNKIFFLQSLRGTKVIRRSLVDKDCNGLTVTPSFDPAMDEEHESSLPIITIYIDPEGCVQEPGATSKTKKHRFPMVTKRRKKSSNQNAKDTPISFIIGTLLHEMAHAFINLFVCKGDIYAYPNAGLNNGCHSQFCRSIHRFNLGETGHGRVWWRLATAIENNSSRILGFKTPVIATLDLEGELKKPQGWLPSQRHDIPEFFENDKKHMDAIERARKERAMIGTTATNENSRASLPPSSESSSVSTAIDESRKLVMRKFTRSNYTDALFFIKKTVLPTTGKQAERHHLANTSPQASRKRRASNRYRVDSHQKVNSGNAGSISPKDSSSQTTINNQDLTKKRKRRRLNVRGSSEATNIFLEVLDSEDEDVDDHYTFEDADIESYRYMCLLK